MEFCLAGLASRPLSGALDQSDVHVGVVLDDGARGEDGLGVLRVVGERVAQVVERLSSIVVQSCSIVV